MGIRFVHFHNLDITPVSTDILNLNASFVNYKINSFNTFGKFHQGLVILISAFLFPEGQ